MTNILAKLENMPVSFTRELGWELFDMLTGEIFTVESERAAKALRAIAIKTDTIPWRFARVRSNERNEWSTYRYNAFDCHCCGAPLNVEIDPDNICMDCIDIGCTIESEK